MWGESSKSFFSPAKHFTFCELNDWVQWYRTSLSLDLKAGCVGSWFSSTSLDLPASFSSAEMGHQLQFVAVILLGVAMTAPDYRRREEKESCSCCMVRPSDGHRNAFVVGAKRVEFHYSVWTGIESPGQQDPKQLWVKLCSLRSYTTMKRMHEKNTDALHSANDKHNRLSLPPGDRLGSQHISGESAFCNALFDQNDLWRV